MFFLHLVNKLPQAAGISGENARGWTISPENGQLAEEGSFEWQLSNLKDNLKVKNSIVQYTSNLEEAVLFENPPLLSNIFLVKFNLTRFLKKNNLKKHTDTKEDRKDRKRVYKLKNKKCEFIKVFFIFSFGDFHILLTWNYHVTVIFLATKLWPDKYQIGRTSSEVETHDVLMRSHRN